LTRRGNVEKRTSSTVPALRRTFGGGVPAWAVFLIWWTGLALLFALKHAAVCACEEEPIVWGEALLNGFAHSYSWAGIALIVLWVTERVRLERSRWPLLVPLHLCLALVLVTARAALLLVVSRQLYLPSGELYLGGLIGNLPAALFVYLLLLGSAYVWQYFCRTRDRKLDVATLEARLAAARVDLLAVQLQPEFVFTVLRSTAALARHDAEAAGRMLARLGELLRLMLSHRERSEIALAEEVQALRLYLEIERALGGDEFEVGWSLEPCALGAVVPRMMLQPVVERMLRHTASPVAGTRRFTFQARCGEGGIALVLTVRITQQQAPSLTVLGFESSPAVATLRARLARHCGEAHRCDVRTGQREIVVSLTVPLRAADEASLPEPATVEAIAGAAG
jgi:two-component system, LytTR family, sensor kinase